MTYRLLEDPNGDRSDGYIDARILMADPLTVGDELSGGIDSLLREVNGGITGLAGVSVLRNQLSGQLKACESAVKLDGVDTESWQVEIDKRCMDPELFRDLGESGYIGSGNMMQFIVEGVEVTAVASLNGFNLSIGGHDVQLGRSGKWVQFGRVPALPQHLEHITARMIFDGVRDSIGTIQY